MQDKWRTLPRSLHGSWGNKGESHMEERIQAFSGSPSLIFLANPVILELALLSTPAAVIPLRRPWRLLLWRLHPLWLLRLRPWLPPPVLRFGGSPLIGLLDVPRLVRTWLVCRCVCGWRQCGLSVG